MPIVAYIYENFYGSSILKFSLKFFVCYLQIKYTSSKIRDEMYIKKKKHEAKDESTFPLMKFCYILVMFY